MPHGAPKKGNELFCPVVRFSGSIEDVYLYNDETCEPLHQEMLNLKALRQYAKSEARRRNNSILREFYTSQVNIKNKVR